MKINGDYPVYGGGNISYYINQYNREDDIIIAKDGISANCIRYEKNKFFLNHHGWTLIFKDDTIIKKYMFYYLQSIQPELLSIAKGMAQLGINQENFYKIKIPIPSIEKQLEIVEYLDFIYDNIIKKNIKKIEDIKKLNKYYLSLNISFNTELEIKTLGEVCEFQNGYSFKSTDYEDQTATNIGILQIKSIQNGYININKITEYITENQKYKLYEIKKGDILIALSGATTGKIGLYDLDKIFYLNQRVGKINVKNSDIINYKYIYYWYICLDIDNKILNLAKGTAQPNISTNDISEIKIQIPPIEKQLEIVEYLNFNNDLIKTLEKENEINKNNAEQLLKNVLYKD